MLGSPRTHRALTSRLARASGLTAVAPDYRLAPEYPHPAALDDAAAVFAALVTGGTPAGRLVCAGDSAGGGLVSPLRADLAGLPPVLIHAAGQELLIKDVRRLQAARVRDGVACELRVFEPSWHDFQLYAGVVPGATQSVLQLAAFAR